MKPVIRTLAVALLSVTACVGDAEPPMQPSAVDALLADTEGLVDPAFVRTLLDTRAEDARTRTAAAATNRTAAGAAESEASCTTIDFETVGDLLPVGSVSGASFGSSWFGLVDLDEGGSGPFANEPSPSTIALQLDDTDVSVALSDPAAHVSLYYSALAEGLPLSLEGLDDAAQVVASAQGTTVGADGQAPPCDGDPTGWFCGWSLLEISAEDALITTLHIQGPDGSETAWGIDDLMLCGVVSGEEPGAEDNVAIDIKPGSDENPVNPMSRGKLPVALFGGEELDVSQVDLATVSLGDGEGDDTPLATRGRDRPMAQTADVNDDGYPDLLLHFEVNQLVANGDLTWETTKLVLLASLVEGSGSEAGALSAGSAAPEAAAGELRGSGAVRVVPSRSGVG